MARIAIDSLAVAQACTAIEHLIRIEDEEEGVMGHDPTVC